jgi:hypothetical protein
LGIAPLLSGSGKFDTPRERMQAEKASGLDDAELRADPSARGGPPEPDGDDGLPPQAATSMASAIRTAELRAVHGGRRSTRTFIVSS